MSNTAISVEKLSKLYSLGNSSSGSIYDTFNNLFKSKKQNDENSFWALDDLSFDIKYGEAVGIVGRNGAGKSTLLKVLSRITQPTKGKFTINGRVSSLLEVGTGFHPELSGRENIFLNGTILGMSRSEIRNKFDEIIDFSGVEKFLDTPVKHYSSGMYVKLAFSVAAHLEPEILIIDEVLAVGDAQFQKKCLGKMSEVTSEGRTVLFVSHNMGAVASLCNKGLLLDKGGLLYEGDINTVISSYINQGGESCIEFNSPPVSKASIKQINDHLKVNIIIDSNEIIKYPNLGFVIYDLMGNPIFGTNPLKSGIQDFSMNKKKGSVSIIIDEPKLADGKYSISLWLNDGKGTEIFQSDKELSFEVNKMRTYIEKNTSQEGLIIPKCQFIID